MIYVTMDTVKLKNLALGMYAIDVELIPPHNRNNKEVHLDYLKHLKESLETVCEIVEEARIEKPLDNALASACLYTKLSQELLVYVIGTCPKEFSIREQKVRNFMKQFIEIVRFRNDHFGAIIVYRDYMIGDSVISEGTPQRALGLAWQIPILVAACYKGCHIFCRLLQRLHAAVKAATKLDGYYEGCHIGPSMGSLRRRGSSLNSTEIRLCECFRLLQRLHAAVKAATKLDGCYEGCHACCKLLRRLPYSWQATTKVSCCWEGWHIGGRLLQMLNDVVKAATRLLKVATKVASCSEEYNRAYWLLHRLPHRIHAATRIACCCNGCNIGRDALTLRLQGGAFSRAFDRAFNEAFCGAFYRAFYRAFYEVFEEKGVFSELNRD
uniref:Uncharacterized protein n=1 Tax=Tanacetum cinerariifolium TaxID=118510 RepID=A0A6L2M582_TANCI|nr:hypothetical protein [Tanacetum cinerariifolium]